MRRFLVSAIAALFPLADTLLGAPPSIINLNHDGHNVKPTVVNADGTVIAGARGTRMNFRWTIANGYAEIGSLGGEYDQGPLGISADGNTIVGTSRIGGIDRGFKWTAAAGMQDANIYPAGRMYFVQGISPDGTKILGTGGNPPPLPSLGWRTFVHGAGGLSIIGNTTEIVGEFASGMSADASVVAIHRTVGPFGNQNLIRGFRWTSAEGFQELPRTLPTSGPNPGAVYKESIPWAVSADGSVFIGALQSPEVQGSAPFGQAARWVLNSASQDMVLEPLGMPPGAGSSFAAAMSADGSRIGGWSYMSGGTSSGGYPGTFTATYWTPELGTVSLASYIAALGGDLSDWQLEQVSGISADGTTIIGTGLYDNQPAGWAIRGLPPIQVPGPGTAAVVVVAGAVVTGFRGRREREVRGG